MDQDVEIELCVKEVMDNKGVSISELSRMADIKYDIDLNSLTKEKEKWENLNERNIDEEISLS